MLFPQVLPGRGGAPPSPGAQGSPLFGHAPDFGYLYYGAIWYGNEIWNGGRLREADANGDGTTDDVELLQWLDKNRPGKNDFQPWTKTTHPTLGAVEVGGWNPKFWSQNPPPEMIETWARNEAMFNLYLAQQLPQVRIVSATSKPAGEGAFDVTVTVTNEGLLPTALEIAKRVKIVREDTVSIDYQQGQTVTRVELLERIGLSARAHERARNLSYGEQRRVEIARALAAEPRLLLLDEPTAGMNPVEVQAVAALIRSVAEGGRAVLLIEHNVTLVMDVCHRITVLNFGRAIATGTPEEVGQHPEVIKAYLGETTKF